ncbi:MAG: acetoacetyl-CoA synthase [Sulfurimonas sp. RIFCSPLOWO2_12_FULL_36_74]|uniref:type II toxin-antitoxin system CcdA family antitoxin n=1 Tax=unclassified Sulfurimonas TaxID=2623549 RepID=UPI0008B48D4D|nr:MULTISPECIES: type II toxin-antitoxin system CcdA family antitoxin [unclassified Sulfurimonas]OHD98763.1 MAG: acetoacetyl-CoA synthase [Sulfurimonas sp. RIFCSPLOWO2_02_FULL_36_28]OHE02458.1 MAG: acetoacetyl-CoA synthase [Sulfurimonas sp. RIFCSPLOWO2_12_36_12]OHE06802.1 MAG: acetoacetyl-CoA synthase [Sulfurimonas sp. RIFCSPLOWO2_12_FULL_36_74]
MTALYNPNAKKKATNLSINSDLLKKAKELHINISNSLEKTLIELIKEKEMKNWESQNKTSINSYNERVSKHGTFSDEIRSF